MPIGLVLADPHPIVLDGLEHLFQRESGFTVLARCQTGDETLDAVRKHRPDVLILDIHPPAWHGLAVLDAMKREKLPTRIVLFTAVADEAEILEAMHRGAKGVVLKEMAPRLLVQCVRKVHAGEQWLERRSAGAVMEKLLRREAGARELGVVLTPREIAIVNLAARGLRNKEIASQLNITEGTVKLHLHNIYDKLQVKGRGPLTLLAQQRGLV
jgi:two-component system, NarL family, nitrate/nitrite response regulator NarL